MASINQRGGKLFFDYRWHGKRQRIYTHLPDTAGNRKRAEAVLRHINDDIAKGIFDPAAYFPDNPHPTPPQARQPIPAPEGLAHPLQSQPMIAACPATPTFRAFANDWFDEMRPQWRTSYQKNLRLTLDAHLIPNFGDDALADITKSDILGFRAKLSEPTPQRPEGLSASRINHILCLMKQINRQA